MHCFCSMFRPPHMSDATHYSAATASSHAALLPGSCAQHRCQVVALRLRSAARAGDPASDPRGELDYAALLNRALPGDIRVLGWAPVPAGFSARFSTLHRTYRRGPCAKPLPEQYSATGSGNLAAGVLLGSVWGLVKVSR